MFYWFTRGDDACQYEAREVSPVHFELRITGAAGTVVEVFETADALHRRQVALERELLSQGWMGPHGWTL